MTAKKTETKKTAPKPETKKAPEAAPKKAAASKPSTVESPVALVHAACDKMKGAPRKDVLAALVAKGVNKFTAATQYQRWRKAHAK